MGILDMLGSAGDDRAYVRAEAAERERRKEAAGRYLVGLDLGQRDDWTALAVVHSHEKEATAFQMKLSASGHDSYSARSGEHYDLLLAVTLPVWWRRHYGGHGRAGVWII